MIQNLSRLPLPPLPLAPLGGLMSLLMRQVAQRHPVILRRLGPHAGARILLDVTDAPLLMMMEPALRRITLHTRANPPHHDAAIKGPLKGFLEMLHGNLDGDALFFSGELEIAGDTAAVLALRNALDDAELDLTAEMVALGGPVGPLVQRLAALVERTAGLSLHRVPYSEGY